MNFTLKGWPAVVAQMWIVGSTIYCLAKLCALVNGMR